MRKLARDLLALSFLTGACVPAEAATYTDTYTVDPATLACGYFVTTEICQGYQLIDPIGLAPRYLNAGDELTETVQYTSPVFVRGSNTGDTFFISLPDINAYVGDTSPGPNTATVTSTLQGYSGPPAPYGGPYTAGWLNKYLANVGFSVEFGGANIPNTGFSATGITSHFLIVNGDPYPTYTVYYGTGSVLPATPQVISDIAGGTVDHPAILPTGLVGQVSGAIGGADNASHNDFYQFNWDGGDGEALFQATATMTDAEPGDIFNFELFRPADHTLIQDLVLNDNNAFTQTMSVELASGAYVIGMTTDTPIDPEYTITFNTPVTGTASVDAPEPSSLALLAGALIAVSSFAKRRKRRHTLDMASA